MICLHLRYIYIFKKAPTVTPRAAADLIHAGSHFKSLLDYWPHTLQCLHRNSYQLQIVRRLVAAAARHRGPSAARGRRLGDGPGPGL